MIATDSKTSGSWVQRTPGVCGGRACIRDSRITVWGLVNARRLGMADEQILPMIQGLTRSDLLAAWEYYSRNKTEIDTDIRANEAD